ncbi:cation diffusion facilitator family transporter [Phycicoccus sp. M110.8]|uniref:cation diffusion facilitator family transporter n=1 Tax=Phycicoccus sp. M110.8 TaxID=3075433 RepID=UPI0028FDB08E|nr:cation diffusion facilitator family transporter [Phycicoccus sp. M110.8]MDU0313104.1 cation diffusion facilitator family transporter [Phycicoccus sp. M110.8]
MSTPIPPSHGRATAETGHAHPHPHPATEHGHDHGEHGHGDHGHDHGEHGHGDHGHGDHGHAHAEHDHGDHGHGHGHGHGDHDHDHEHPGGIKGFFLDIFKPHSHDSADSVDQALESSTEGIRAVKISLVALGVTALLQALVVVITGSVALLADTIHNFSDALTAVPLWIAFVLGRRAANRRFTYGYGRAEDIAGVFIVLMITLSAVLAGYESVVRIIDPHPIENVGVVLAAGFLGFVGNELVAQYRIRVGNRIGSAALVADGLHARTDGFTSLAVAVGAVGVMLGFPLADPIIGLLITVAILVVLKGAIVDIGRRLMDAVDPELVDRAEGVLLSVPGVQAVDSLKVRWVGHRLRAETGVEIAGSLDVFQAHDIAHEAERRLVAGVPKLVEATVHVSPAPVPATTEIPTGAAAFH